MVFDGWTLFGSDRLDNSRAEHASASPIVKLNMKKLLAVIICFPSFLALSSVALDRLALLPLSYMVEKTEIIAIGKVVKVQKTTEKRDNLSFSKTTIEIERTLKDNRHTRSIDVFFFPGGEDEPEYSLGDKSIFFIHKFRGKFVVLQGYAGKVDILNNEVRNIHMYKEPSDQRLDGFIDKIEKLIKGKNTEGSGRNL